MDPKPERIGSVNILAGMDYSAAIVVVLELGLMRYHNMRQEVGLRDSILNFECSILPYL